MAEPYVAQISCFACSFSPRNWAYCNGQLLSISQNTALFSLIGTFYGGNGTTNFALPNFKGQSPMHWGSGPGLTPTDIGEVQGSAGVTLTSGNLPPHTNQIYSANVAVGSSGERTPGPTGTSYVSASTSPNAAWKKVPTAMNALAAGNAIGVTGNSQPHENRQPYLVLNLCIAITGVFPSRN